MGKILTPAIDGIRHIAPALKLVQQPAPADSFDPIRRSPSLHELLVEVDAKAKTDAQRITALEQTLADVVAKFVELESDLLVELQTALNETCAGYHDDGHAARVARVYGLRMEGCDEQPVASPLLRLPARGRQCSDGGMAGRPADDLVARGGAVSRDTSGPAFPATQDNGCNSGVSGMTLRDYFAAKALAGMASAYHENWTVESAAAAAYELADAMLKERAK